MSEYDFTKIVREMGQKENISDCTLELKHSSKKGDGYFGTVQAVRLVGSRKKLDVVFKFSHRNPKSHESLPLRKVYLNEIYFYEEIVPAFDKFQEDNGIHEPFDNVPKFYGSVNETLNELLVLEDLTVKDYYLWDRTQLMNKEHLEFALKTFAKFHGTSYAMQKINPQMYNKLADSLQDDIFFKVTTKMGLFEHIQAAIEEMIYVFDAHKEKHYVDCFKKFRDNLLQEVEVIRCFHDDTDVISQGDCWCNNGLYHYKNATADRTKPDAMKMLDFQMMRLGSPAMDLAYFFYTASPKESCDNFEYFLKVYHVALDKHLAKFNLRVEEIYPYTKFLEHWQKLCKFGLLMSFLIRKIMLTEGKDAPDITEGNFLNNVHFDQEIEKLYHQQMKDLVVHFVDNKFI